MIRTALLLLCGSLVAFCQSVVVREAPTVTMPGEVDSNSPAFWIGSEFHLLNSTGNGPMLSRGADQFSLGQSEMAQIFRPDRDWPTWIESIWRDPSGLIFGWYHQEHEYICDGKQRPAMPRIGAAISYDDGRTFHDLGIILESGTPPDCSSQNGYFAGGHGDFSVIPDREQKYFYFLFGNYGGPVESQGVAIARMAFEERFAPAGRVWKYYQGDWTEPGIAGNMTPIFPARMSWQVTRTNAVWGPSIHWNTFLETYVVLLNRSCCTAGWPQKGIYISFNADLSKPEGWRTPRKILDDTGWYPQVLGLGEGETDSIAGRTARLYVYGQSRWELTFRKPASAPTIPEE